MSDSIDNNEKSKTGTNYNINELSHLLTQIKEFQKVSSEINRNINKITNKITNKYINIKKLNDDNEIPEDFGNDNSDFSEKSSDSEEKNLSKKNEINSNKKGRKVIFEDFSKNNINPRNNILKSKLNTEDQKSNDEKQIKNEKYESNSYGFYITKKKKK